jgi:hypothetical protein
VDARISLISAFGLGVFAQVALLLNRNINFRGILGCAAFAAFAMVPGKHEHDYEPLFHLLMAFSFFSFMVALTYRKEILPILSEAMLLAYTILFWFAFYPYIDHGTPLQRTLLEIAVVPTAMTLYMAIYNGHSGGFLKLTMYAWFLIIIVCLGVLQFPVGDLAIFYKDRQIPWITPFESAVAGMAFMYLLANATYIFDLIPIPGRNQSWKERMKDWAEFSDLLIQRVSDEQITVIQAMVVLVAELSVLFLNSVYHWLPSELMINLAIVVPGILLQFVAKLQSPANGQIRADAP